MADDASLRPLERRIRRLVNDGVSQADIARRFRRSPEFVGRVLALSELPSRSKTAPVARPVSPLRPLERRILRWRDEGAAHAEIGPMFRRSADFVERVEDLARYKLAQ